MNKILISTLLMLGVLSANAFMADIAPSTPAPSNAEDVVGALSRLAQAEGRKAATAAAAQMAAQSQNNTPLLEQGVRSIVGGLFKGVGGLLGIVYEHPLLTMTLGTAAGIYCFIQYQQVRHFAFMQLPTRVQTVCNAFYGLTEPAIVPATVTDIERIVAEHEHTTTESRAAIQTLQDQLHGAIERLNTMQTGTAQAQDAQRTALSEQIAHIQQELVAAQQEHVRVLEQQQKETEERITHAFQAHLRTQLAQHAHDLQTQQQAARRELDQHVQEFSLRLAALQATVERLCAATQDGFSRITQEVRRQTSPRALTESTGSIRIGDRVLNPSIPRSLSLPNFGRDGNDQHTRPFVLSGNLPTRSVGRFGLSGSRSAASSSLLPLTFSR